MSNRREDGDHHGSTLQDYSSWNTINERGKSYNENDENGDDDGTVSNRGVAVMMKKDAGNRKRRGDKVQYNGNGNASAFDALMDLEENQDPLDYLRMMERNLQRDKSGKAKQSTASTGGPLSKRALKRHQEGIKDKARRKQERREKKIEKEAVTKIEFQNDVNLELEKERKRKEELKKAQQQQRPPTVQQAAEALTSEAAKEAIARTGQTYPNERLLQLKDITGWLESKFTAVQQWRHSYSTLLFFFL